MFSNNTVGVSALGQLLMVGGGPDPDPAQRGCAARWTLTLPGSPLLGSVATDEAGVVYAWTAAGSTTDPDLLAITDDGGAARVLWQTTFTGDDDIVIGTLTTIEAAAGRLLGIPIVLAASHETVAVDRATGAVGCRQPVADDSINSLVVGPDGSAYVPLLGILDLTSPNPNASYQGGITKYRRLE